MQPTQIFATLRKLLVPLILTAAVLVCALGARSLLQHLDVNIQENGKISMQAVVEQVQQTYELQVGNYYSRLRMVEKYVSRDLDDPYKRQDFKFLIRSLQKETNSQIMFIKDNGIVMSLDKKKTKLDISSTLLLTLKNDQGIAKLININSGQEVQSGFLLAIPCEQYELAGEDFAAVGMLIDRSEMDSALKLYAYGNEGYLFMLDGDGDVVYTNQTDEKLFQNYALLKHLSKDGALTDEQMKSLNQSFADGNTGVELLGGDNGYYLGYSPMQTGGSTLVCIVRQGAVDNTLTAYQQTILRAIFAMAVVLFALLAALFLSISRMGLANQRAAFERENLKRQRENVKALRTLNVELEEAQAATVQALQTAEAASKAKTDFLSNMSHDIRTPLNAIIGISALIEHDPGNEQKVREYVRRIGVSSQTLLAIINEVLDMNKIESGKTTLNSVDFSLYDLTAGLEDIFRPQIDAKHQSFELVMQDIEHPWLCGDSVRLMQVFSNLLSNAVKYTQEGGSIQFSIQERPTATSSYARFSFLVKDNGVGMEESFKDKIFDAFTREESTLVNKVQGTGLGMAISKNLIELMGGTIDVSSQKGNGTCFEVALDLKISQNRGDIPQAQRRAEHCEGVSLQQMRFLCAEDNALNAEILEELLKMEGASCVICQNGKELVETFEQSKPGDFDMILMDVQMPVMNGYEATRAIRASSHELACSIFIIAMTANAFSEDIQASFAAGMNAHVSKPVDMNVLKKTIGNLQSGCGGGLETPVFVTDEAVR